MSWREEWKALAGRIDGLLAAGHLFFASLPHVGVDYHAASNIYILPAARALREDLSAYLSSYDAALPARAAGILQKYLTDSEPLAKKTDTHGIQGVQGFLVSLAVFRGEFGHAMEDAAAIARNLVTRGFLHLQRSIVADRQVQNAWRTAFHEGEPSLEKLGATHLLLFGIWAFKCSGTGERTDLVLGGRLTVSPYNEAAVEALVLTEWKRVPSLDEVEAKLAQALRQVRLYSQGVLAGFELASDRYIVLVSERRLPDMPRTLVEDGMRQHIVNIAVAPEVPSRETVESRIHQRPAGNGATDG